MIYSVVLVALLGGAQADCGFTVTFAGGGATAVSNNNQHFAGQGCHDVIPGIFALAGCTPKERALCEAEANAQCVCYFHFRNEDRGAVEMSSCSTKYRRCTVGTTTTQLVVSASTVGH